MPQGPTATPAPRISASMIDHASDALARLLDFTQPADVLLSAYFREHRVLGGRERGFVAETCYAVLRRKRSLEKLVYPAKSPRWLVLASLLRFSGVAQRQLGEQVSAAEKTWLMEFKSRPEPELTLADQADFPDWLVEKLSSRWSATELLALARGLNQSAPLDLRVNSIKAKREEVLARLGAEG
ncbi:MAG: SAM-dependent methyltransferase, partial [Proteobacteria bacterium]|nr:SAM-dependent methyltransferase [Pseudomonadota bacterium]